MRFLSPSPNQLFRISSAAAWPDVEFRTDEVGPHTWHWSITWGAFQRSGQAMTADNRWNARGVIADLGGTLTVRAEAHSGVGATPSGASARTAAAQRMSTVAPAPGWPAPAPNRAQMTRSDAVVAAPIGVLIRGTNPSEQEIVQFLAGKANSAGFERILQHESRFRQFGADDQPVKSFDNGYGMCQLTTPAPTYEQVWNWKLNVEAGLALFEEKRGAAINYLGQGGRAYTADQLKREAVCRWNGGKYHVWDAAAARWTRSPNILCDRKTGNIGWDMTDPENAGKTEDALRKRDSGSYGKPPAATAHWQYSGVCYADRILG